MKTIEKLAALILALAMILTGAALAENAAAERFCDTWVDTGVAVEIWQEDDAFQCRAVLGDGGNESTVLKYANCHYDAATDRLICEDGTRAVETFDEASNELKTDVKATGISAEFLFANGQDALLWNDSEELGVNYTLRRETDAEADDFEDSRAFVGQWVCDRALIDIQPHNGDAFNVTITWGASATEQAQWHYACTYDADQKALNSYEPGSKSVVTYGEGGDPVNTQVEYEDGQASFTLDETGHLHWADAKENAGEGMSFERG